MNVLRSIEGRVGRIVLDRPPLNILTRSVLAELRGVLADWQGFPGLRALVLSANGAHFSAGADVGEHLPPTYAELIPEFVDTIDRLARFPLPVVAAVRGRCLGGGFELAQAADLIVAGEGALFGQPEVVLGVTAPAACALLPRRGNPGAAAHLLFTGDNLTAERARAAGFVERVVPDDEVDTAALALAERMARHSAAALRATKQSLLAGRDCGLSDGLRATARLYIDELMRSEDAAEGLAAFVGKRTPEWKDR